MDLFGVQWEQVHLMYSVSSWYLQGISQVNTWYVSDTYSVRIAYIPVCIMYWYLFNMSLVAGLHTDKKYNRHF